MKHGAKQKTQQHMVNRGIQVRKVTIMYDPLMSYFEESKWCQIGVEKLRHKEKWKGACEKNIPHLT